MVATGQFLLRSANDSQNPFAACLYGKGLTAGKVFFYLNNAVGSRTAFLSILSQGARFRGDLACDGVDRVFYSGFEIPEFATDTSRNWLFHPGKVSSAPDTKVISSVDLSADTFHVVGHGYATDDQIAFWARGEDVVAPSAVIITNQKVHYLVTRIDADNFQIKHPDAGTLIDLNVTPVHLDRLFVYKANVFLFDVDQGVPYFFPALPFTFSGLSYLEILLPENISNGVNEPTNLKVLMRGKQMYGLKNTSGVLAFDTSVITAKPNNALVSADALVNVNKLALSRFGVTSWLSWRDRCDVTIPWVGGNTVPSPRASWASTSGLTYDATADTLTKSGSTDAWDTYVATQQFTTELAQLEVQYAGGDIFIGFGLTASANYTDKQCAVIQGGYLKYGFGGILNNIDQVGIGDKIKIVYDNSGFFIYKNGVEMPKVYNEYTQFYPSFYCVIGVYTHGAVVKNILVAPSGTDSLPRQVVRFQGGIVSDTPLPVSELFEAEIANSAASWADVNGKIEIATETDRTPCFTFYGPGAGVPSNVAKITVKEKDPGTVNNFWVFSYRNDDDLILSQSFVPIDRKDLRARIGGQLITSDDQPYGVMQQSQMERIGAVRVARETDLIVGFTVEAFLDSLVVCKGSYVNVVAPETGYTVDNPALCEVISERFSASDVETRIYEVQITTPDVYSDTNHGAATFAPASLPVGRFTPPPFATDLTIVETNEPMPDGTYVSTISGDVTFGSAPGQRGRVFLQSLVSKLFAVTYDHTTNLFTKAASDVFPSGSTPIAVASSSNTDPGGWTQDVPLYIVNVSGNTCKLSKEIAGTAESFSTNGVNLAFYDSAPWVDTSIDVYADSTGHGAFEIIPARKSLSLVRVQMFSPANNTLPFQFQTYRELQVVGDTTVPLPPTRLEYIFDGVNILFRWDASASAGVAGYIAKDEFGNLLYQGDARSFTLPARTASFTVRVFSYSSWHVISSDSASVTFNLPPVSDWMDITGGVALANGTLQKNVADGWTCGAILNHGLLTNRIGGRISYIIDTDNKKKVIGLTRNLNPSSYADFAFGILFDSDGHIKVLESGVIGADVGEYAIGEQYSLVLEPYFDHPADVDANGRITIVRTIASAEARSETATELVATFSDVERLFPMYVGVALYSNGSIITPSLEATGDLIPVTGIYPTLQDIDNATYDDSTGDYVNTGTPGGASSVEVIPALQDGEYSFTVAAGSRLTIGFNPTDTDNPDAIAFAIRFKADGSIWWVESGVERDEITAGAGANWTISVENLECTIRRGGQLVVGTFNSTVANNDTILVVANSSGGGSISNLKFYPAVESFVDPVSGNTTPVIALYRQAQVGRNAAYAIPEMVFTAPAAGESVTFNDQGQLVNTTISVIDDPTIVALAALTIVDNSLIVGTGTDAFAVRTFAASTFPARASTGDLIAHTISDPSLTFLAQSSQSDMRTTGLGLGALATHDDVTFALMNTSAWSDDTTLASDSSVKFPTIHSVKTYIDTQVTGLKFKLDCRVASTANVTVSSPGAAIDGVTLSNGDRVLLKNQTTASENGVYIFNGSSSALSRALDSDSGSELVSATYPIREGTVNQDTWWTVTNDTITLGSTNIVFTQTGGGGTYTNGAGLTLTGNSFSISTGGVTNAMLAGSIAASKLIGSDIATVGTITTGTWNGTAIDVAHGGTGGTTQATARTGLGLVIGTDVEAHNANLTTIAGLSASNDDFLQRKAGAWTNRTVAQVKTDLNLTGTNSGDVTYSGENYLSLAGQVLSGAPVNLSGSNATGTLAAGRFPALTGHVTTSAGSLATTIGAAVVTFAMLAISAWADDTTLSSDSSTTLPTIHAVKTYIDTQITGLKFKIDVRVASTANVTVSNPGTSTFDSVVLSTGDRILLKNQTTGSENGVYIFNGSSSALTRATDADSGTELVSATFPVRAGTVNQDTWWTVTNDTITLGSTSIVFSQTGGGGTYTNGSGLTLTGNSFSISTGGVTNAMLAGSITASKLVGSDIVTVGTITTGVWNGTGIDVAHGGTGGTTQATARTGLGLVIGTDVEAHNANLTTFAGLSPSNDDLLQRKAGAWTNRTIAQVKADFHLYPIFDIRDYGAVGGSTDDSAAITAAVAAAVAAGGGRVFIPAGTWLAKNIAISDVVMIVGVGSHIDGTSGSIVKLPSGSTNTNVFNITTGYRNVVIRDVTLDCGTATGSTCFQISGSSSAAGIGVQCFNVVFRNGQYGMRIHTTSGLWQTAMVEVSHCTWNNPSSAAVYCDSSNGVYIFNQPYMSLPANAHAFDLPHAGALVVVNAEFAGPSSGTGVCFNVTGQHDNLLIQGCQDEGMGGFLNHGVSDGTYVTTLLNNTIQSPIVFTASGTIVSMGNTYHFSDTYTASGGGTLGVIDSYGDTGVLTTDFFGASTTAWRLKSPENAHLVVLHESSGLTYKTTYNAPVRISLNSIWLGQTSLPGLEIGHTGSEDKLLLRLGRINSSQVFDQTYDFRRDNTTGHLTCVGSQTSTSAQNGFVAFDFNGEFTGTNFRANSARPATITARQDNWVTGSTGSAAAVAQNIFVQSTADRSFTGMGLDYAISGAYPDGYQRMFINESSFNHTLTHEDSLSSATARFAGLGSANNVIPAGGAAMLIYSNAPTGTPVQRWRVYPLGIVYAGENYLTLSGNTLTGSAVNLSGTNVTGTLAAARFPALTGHVTTSAGSLATTIGAAVVTFAMLATAAWSDDTTLSGNSATVIPTVHAVKTYIDTQITGLKFKIDVRVASTANVTVSNPGTSTFDSVVLSSGERILLKNQSTPSENGVYIFNGSGSALTRATDGDSGAELISATFPVREGTVNQDTWWTVTNDTITLGSTSIVFTQTGGAGTYTNGAGLTLTGNSFSITTGGVTNAMLAGSIAYSKLTLTGSVTNADLAGSIAASKLVGSDIATVGTITSGVWNGTAVAVGSGGTGATTATNARSNLGLIIGTHVQAWNAELDVLAALTPTTGNFIVGFSGDWASRSTAQVQTTLKIPKVLFTAFADVTNASVNTWETFYNDTIAANQLVTNGDSLRCTYMGTVANNAHAKYWQMTFGTTTFFDTLASFNGVQDNAIDWRIDLLIMRVSSSVVRCSVLFTTYDAVAGDNTPFVKYTEITSLTLSSTNGLVLNVQSTAASDITAKAKHIQYIPA